MIQVIDRDSPDLESVINAEAEWNCNSRIKREKTVHTLDDLKDANTILLLRGFLFGGGEIRMVEQN